MESNKIINISINSYLGQKGYTISKNEISIEKQKQIRNDLTIKPYVPGAPNANNQPSFPAYRESANKMYLPHYYGVEHFGTPKEYKINDGATIDLEFNGQLRDYQVPVVKKYLEHVENLQVGGGLLELPCAFGKTCLALNIISQLKKKTLIIVHKEFLMNQWIERIGQFLPNARLGKIQGQIIDIDDKDIVIAMLQSLSMKEYPSSLFDSFGLTIIDEVHHIGSEVFSNSLFKLVTKYMLGLSATMNRKDGTTFVFKMFLGNVIFKGTRDETHSVVVRAIEYKVDDDEFNEVKTDFRGNPAYSTMISKLCEYNRRSEFILKILSDLLLENFNQQIMILGHNKNLLKYLYDAITHRNIATVGYYVGGMKESALKESETKKVVIATYAMASEGLDIKTLTTLIMATPKTDIEQSIGRILREKHSSPVVVDIIDSHDLFKNQWKKRKTFYKKENYKIIYTTTSQYSIDINNWTILYNPKQIYEKKCTTKKTVKNSTSLKSNSSRDRSISDDTDSDEEEVIEESKDKFLSGKCLLKFKST
uniref:Helicase ATP-binding domain-containing protein n=1 Tax=viral metagenome TaxID=1070528 RepID=A0A6C0EPM3_9ZZZZ